MRLVAAVLGRTVRSSPSTAVLLGVAVPEPGCWSPKPASRLPAGWPRADATEPWAHVVPLALSLLRGFSLGSLRLCPWAFVLAETPLAHSLEGKLAFWESECSERSPPVVGWWPHVLAPWPLWGGMALRLPGSPVH